MESQKDQLRKQVQIMDEYIGQDNALVQKLTGGKTGEAAVNYMLE